MLAIHELARLSDDELAALGVAEVNRACRQALPGADSFDGQAPTKTPADWRGTGEGASRQGRTRARAGRERAEPGATPGGRAAPPRGRPRRSANRLGSAASGTGQSCAPPTRR